ncbi:unnamed protein product [Pylaiella littoralis]
MLSSCARRVVRTRCVQDLPRNVGASIPPACSRSTDSSSSSSGVDVIARGMAAKAAAGGGKKGGGKGKGGGGAGDAKDNKGEHGLGVTPINFLKDGKDPSVMPDEDYPEWLWNMQLPSLARLKRTKEEDYTLDEFRRFVQLDSREKIKRQNRSGKF